MEAAGRDPACPPPGLRWERLVRPDEVALRIALAPASMAPGRGLVLGLPGRGQFIERWFETMRALQERGFAVAVLDHRGQGGSPRTLPGRQRHHITDFALMAEDALAALALARKTLAAPGPALLLGHSMGGLVALLAALRRPEAVAALLLAAPLVGLKTPLLLPQPLVCAIAGIHVRLGRGTAYAWGQGPWRPPEADPAWHACRKALFTHDDARYRLEAEMIARNPALAVGGVTWGWLAAACRAMADLHRAAETGRPSRPALFVLAGADRVVDNGAARRLARRLPTAEVVDVPGARHELLQEAAEFRMLFWRAVDDFLARHDL